MKVLSISPEGSSDNIFLDAQFTLVFDEEADLDCLKKGNLILVTGAKNLAVYSYVWMDSSIETTAKKLLETPEMQGVVLCDISTEDYLTFKVTPLSPLDPDTTYRILVSDSSLTKTLADFAQGPNNGNGSLSVTGPYTGTQERSLSISISSEGQLGVATYTYILSGDARIRGPFVVDRACNELSSLGLSLNFASGFYEVNDSWSLNLVPGEKIEEAYVASYLTCSQPTTEIPKEQKSVYLRERIVNGLEREESIVAPDATRLELLSVTPQDRSSGFKGNEIVFVFNKELDPASVTAESIRAVMETLPTVLGFASSYPILVAYAVSGSTLRVRFNG